MHALVMMVFLACGGADEPKPGEEGADCQTAGDCSDGFVCLSDGSDAACAPICTGSVDECGADATCGGVGVLEVDVCQEPKTEEEQQDPEEQPRIPCATDDECSALSPGAICAEWKGQRDCTIPCDVESDCTPPTIGGITMDFMTCIEDSAAPRLACLPDEACFNNPLACIEGLDSWF